MKINYAHLCDYALIAKDGKPSVIGIFGRINPPALPFVLPQLYLAFELEFSYAEVGRAYELRIDAVDSDGRQLLGLKTTLTLQPGAKPGDRVQVPQIIGLSHLRFTRAGAHDFNIFVNEELKHQLSFMVQQATQPAGPSPTPPEPPPSNDPQP